MTVQLVNDHREFTWLSSDLPPTVAPNSRGAKGHVLDTGARYIHDGNGWVEDLTAIYAAKLAAF